jgi:hypothetical protein
VFAELVDRDHPSLLAAEDGDRKHTRRPQTPPVMIVRMTCRLWFGRCPRTVTAW